MEKGKRLSIDGAAIVDKENLYFAIGNGNGLFCYNLYDKQLVFLGSFPSENKEQCELYHCAVKYNDYLLFPPHYADRFAIYDIKKQTFGEWDFLPQMKDKSVGRSILYQDKLYLFGTWANPYLYVVDLKSGNAYFHKEWMSKIHPAGCNERVHISTTGLNQNMGKLFLTATKSMGAEVICLDLEDENIERIELPVYPHDFQWVYATAYVNGTKVWAVVDENGKILELDRDTSRYVLFENNMDETAEQNSYLRIFQDRDDLILVPYMADRIVKMNVATGKVNALFCEDDNEVKEYGKGWGKYSWIDYEDGRLYVFRRYNCSLKIIDVARNQAEEIIFYDKNNVARMYAIDGTKRYEEGFTVNNTLEFYMDDICKRSSENMVYSMNCGKRIHDFLTRK